MNDSGLCSVNSLKRDLLSKSYSDLTDAEKNMRSRFEIEAKNEIYCSRFFPDNSRENSLIGKSINLSNGIEPLARHYFQKGSLSENQYFKLLELEEMVGTNFAIDYLDCRILEIRELGSLLFKDELI